MASKFQTVAIFSTLFFSSYILFTSPFEAYIPYLFMILFTPFLVVKYSLPRGLWYVITVLVVTGSVGVLVGDNESGYFIKILVNVIINIFFFSKVIIS